MAVDRNQQGYPVRAVLVSEDGGPPQMQLSGSSMDLRGLIADRPAASSVTAGTTYWAVDRLNQVDEVSVSDGSIWTNI